MNTLYKVLTLSLAWGLMFGNSTQANNFNQRADARFGVEINILWPLPPFRTYEIKFTAAIDDHFSAVLGYGNQNWTYEGDRHNRGKMTSHALLVGVRSFPWSSNNSSLEYTAWLAQDHFTTDKGETLSGFSLAHEFYVGYLIYLPDSRTYVLPQWNAGFYSYKAYRLAKDDNYVFDFLPKVSLGRDFK